ncbi:hypothetical protein [Noviherbaspirillum sp.]|uniref:hypothetical protein n=1 Tax=Noviherbaspirillum sp. TaxID=1926288 RepID=UPI002FE3DD8E
MAYDSDIPNIEAKNRADRDAVNGGQIVSTWAGQQAQGALQEKQTRDTYPTMPTSTPTLPVGKISWGPSNTTSGWQAKHADADPFTFCATVGAALLAFLALIQGSSFESVIGAAVAGAIGGAVIGLAFLAIVAILEFALKIIAFLFMLAVWGVGILFVLQLIW